MVLQVPRIGLCKVSLVLGLLDVSLHEVHHHLEFFILLGEGLHPLYQLVSLLGSLSYSLQMHNDNDEFQSTTSKTSTPDAILTSICFITLQGWTLVSSSP